MRDASLSVRQALLSFAVLVSASVAFAQNELAEVQVQMAEAQRYFNALEYERVIPPLDRVIAILTTRKSDDMRKLLADAYEMRARARFGASDQNGARDDFVALLKVEPGRTLPGQVSPRVVAIFEDAQKATITTLRLMIVPPTAEVTLNGQPVKTNATLSVLVGEHTIAATQLGYRPGSATVTAAPGAENEAKLELARSSAVLSIVTSPAEVEVVIDGLSRGKTNSGPPPADYAARASKAGVPMSALSSVLVLPDLGVGAHRIEFRRACYVPAERRVEVTQLQDIVLDPVKLDSALGTVAVTSTQPNTIVFVDGQERGPAPFTTQLCEGEHTVEMRSAVGRYARRVDVRPGQKIDVSGTMRPAFAIVSATPQSGVSTDLRTAVERALEPVRSISLFAPAAERLTQTLRSSQLPADWLSFDNTKRPIGATADISVPTRRELSTRVARAFDAQGIASVTIPSTLNRNRVVVSLLSAGSADPDIVEVSLDRSESVADAVALLDRPVQFLRPSIGLTAIDVADMPGAVVVGVAAGGPAAQAGVELGDVVLKTGDAAVADASALAASLASRAANDTLSLEMKDKTGAPKKAEVKVQMTPRVIGLSDQTLLANRLLVDFRTRLLSPANPTEESIIRLNLAAALARLQAWGDARTELQRVKLPEQPGVGNGTVQYLLGLCADNLGNRAEAEAAWRAATSSESWLTDDGPPVKELAEARIAELSRRPAR
jgi:hypothetical protein